MSIQWNQISVRENANCPKFGNARFFSLKMRENSGDIRTKIDWFLNYSEWVSSQLAGGCYIQIILNFQTQGENKI